MNTYYPAVFHREEHGYSVSVPDLDGCFTQGDTIEEAMEMAQDAIGLYLDDETELTPSAPESVETQNGDFIMMIAYDKIAYAKKHNCKSVKKTLSIPAWLNESAEAANINFSGVLQEALKAKLNV